nr:hypothetical protein [Tanacetum cinerariifolium]
MIKYSALCDNNKQHRKKIDEQEILFDKMSRLLVEMNNNVLRLQEKFDKMSRQIVEMNNNMLRLQEKILEKETKISELEGCVSNKDVEIEKCLERLNECENKLHKIEQTNQTIHMIMPSKDTLYNGRKGIGFENLTYFEKAKDLRPSLYDEKVIGLGYTPMFLIHSDEALEIEKFKRARENKIEFAYDYGNLNANYVNEKINFSDDYFQEILNPDFEKIDSPFQQTSSLKPLSRFVHMTGNRALLTNIVEKFLGTVRFGNNDFAVIAGYGDVVIGSMTINKVYYAEGLPKIKFEKDHLYSACEQGKIHRKHHKSKTAFALKKPLYLLHMDLCGLMRIENEALDVIISFIKKTQVNLQLQVQRVRTDNGTEFKNKTLAKFFGEVGITQQFSSARTPQQNGIVERRNRTLVEAARTMLTFANPPLFLWAEAIVTACFTQNRLIIHKHSRERECEFDEISEMVSKQFSLEPGLSNLNEMGKSSNPSVSQVSETSKKDLEDLFQKIYDEYFDSSKIMKSLTTNVETSNVEIPSNEEEVFRESSESFQEESSSSSLNDDVQQSSEEVGVPLSNTQSISNNMIPNVDEASTSHNVFNERLEDAYFDASTSFHDSSNVHTFYQPYPHKKKWTKDRPLHKIIGDPKSSVRIRGQLENSCLFSCLLSSIEPANVVEALKYADWVSAMQDEFDQFARLKVWRLVSRP